MLTAALSALTGIALPVIFISGSINSTVVGRYILNRALPNSSIRYINNKKGWLVWIGLIASITLIAWVCSSRDCVRYTA